LGNIRQNGVRGLFVTCQACGYHTEVNVDAWLDDVPVPSFGPRMRCSQCGKLGATAIPPRAVLPSRLDARPSRSPPCLRLRYRCERTAPVGSLRAWGCGCGSGPPPGNGRTLSAAVVSLSIACAIVDWVGVLPAEPASARCHDARQRVDRPAGSERHYDGDWPRRKGLRGCVI